uniref:DUF3338 domain-containing protein n=1 Tax=Dracunculus medinensis TaxID=318479 RepID=A0A0N4UM65_DRAME
LYQELKKRKNILEEKLLAKLDELREVCIQEAEITGEMPREIYKTLMPGEGEPKVKRRIGTAFSLSDDVLKKNDRISMLETDVELHRKIVAAAERLAKDKSANKSVRKKRQKDLVAATQKLRGLEIGLHQLRLSTSKPDVSETKQTWSNILNRNGSNMVAKSCPATPRGSFPDLSTDNEKCDIDDEKDTDYRQNNNIRPYRFTLILLNALSLLNHFIFLIFCFILFIYILV